MPIRDKIMLEIMQQDQQDDLLRAIGMLKAYAKASEFDSSLAVPGSFDNVMKNVLKLYNEHYGEGE